MCILNVLSDLHMDVDCQLPEGGVSRVYILMWDITEGANMAVPLGRMLNHDIQIYRFRYCYFMEGCVLVA